MRSLPSCPIAPAMTTLAITVALMLASTSYVGLVDSSAVERATLWWRAPGAAPVAPSQEVLELPPRIEPRSVRTPRAELTPAPLLTRPSPQVLRIGTLGVTAPLVQVGLLSDGGMEIPDDVNVVGWYAVEGRTISPGDPGTAVLAGHRDSRRAGPGALHALAKVAEGDVINVLHEDGSASEWHVTEIMMTPRDALPVAELFTNSGAPRLAVVTCGGWFNLLTRSYSHNTIVIAHRMTPAPAARASTSATAVVLSI